MEIRDFLKSWKRMCNSMTEMNGCEDCSIVRNTHGARCGDMPCEMQDVESIAREIEKWAAEHPEPVYPTWKEWLEEQRVVVHFDSVDKNGTKVKWELTNKSNCPIPADIAEKLGIAWNELKEG